MQKIYNFMGIVIKSILKMKDKEIPDTQLSGAWLLYRDNGEEEPENAADENIDTWHF